MAAARRIARTIFLGSAPSSVASKVAARGLDRAHIVLGCLQPGQAASIYADALGRLADRLHYLNASGDRSQDATRFWFDTRANLRREMEDRMQRFDPALHIHPEIQERVKNQTRSIFTALRRADAFFVVGPAPHCSTWF